MIVYMEYPDDYPYERYETRETHTDYPPQGMVIGNHNPHSETWGTDPMYRFKPTDRREGGMIVYTGELM